MSTELERRAAHAFNYHFTKDEDYTKNFLGFVEVILDRYEEIFDTTVAPDLWKRPDGVTYRPIFDDDEWGEEESQA